MCFRIIEIWSLKVCMVSTRMYVELCTMPIIQILTTKKNHIVWRSTTIGRILSRNFPRKMGYHFFKLTYFYQYWIWDLPGYIIRKPVILATQRCVNVEVQENIWLLWMSRCVTFYRILKQCCGRCKYWYKEKIYTYYQTKYHTGGWGNFKVIPLTSRI